MKKLSEQDIRAIETALSAKGAPKVEVKVEKGEIVVLKVSSERVK